jgi:hypothetical protein
VKINGNKESSQEGNKEDRKEEISFPLHVHTHFFRLGEKFSSLLFAVSSDMKLYSGENFKQKK